MKSSSEVQLSFLAGFVSKGTGKIVLLMMDEDYEALPRREAAFVVTCHNASGFRYSRGDDDPP